MRRPSLRSRASVSSLGASLGVTLAVALVAAGCATPPPATSGCVPACPAGQTCSSTNVCVSSVTPPDMSTPPIPPDLTPPTCSPRCAGATPICDENRLVCVTCLADADCPSGNICSHSYCVPGCKSDDRCKGSDAGASLACCGGGCIDTSHDPYNCGGCGKTCTAANASSTCTDGVCGFGKCNAGYADCNQMPADGCEVSTRSDVNNCGGCGKTCAVKNGVAGCDEAIGCYLSACKFGFDDCNMDPTDGCEASVLSDEKNCGSCGNNCNSPGVPHAKAGCGLAQCQINSCDQGWADCDGLEKTGCETSILSDSNNCGACNNKCGQGLICKGGGCTCPNCAIPNASATCVNFICIFQKCNPGFVDCDNNIKNGCETDVTGDVNNCGACGKKCGNGEVCDNGTCKAIQCMRMGWFFGRDAWMCPQGLRLPTVNEWAQVLPCITQQDMTMFGYYHDVGSVVGGCNCKWNGGWCGQPSIDTVMGGRMCGDFNQLMVCISQ